MYKVYKKVYYKNKIIVYDMYVTFFISDFAKKIKKGGLL